MLINASRSLRAGAFHKPIYDLKCTMVALNAFSKADAWNGDSHDLIHKTTIRTNRELTHSLLQRQETAD